MALLLSPEDRHSNPTDIFAAPVRRVVESADPFARYRQLLPSFSAQDIGNQMSFIDLSIILPDTYLEKVDRSTMAVGLEVRVPFLDNDLVDYAVQLSGMEKNPLGRQKYLLKAALKDVVPDDILRAPKTGFSVPYGRWLKTSMQSLFEDQLSRFARVNPDVLDRARINTLMSRTRTGVQDHSPLLWKILNLVVWANSKGIDFGSRTSQ
jgi:asparagine synthase (glutamine-hydrolysing)